MHKKIVLQSFLLIFLSLFQSNNYCNLFEAGIYSAGLSKEELGQKIKSEIRNERNNIIINRLFQLTCGGASILIGIVSIGALCVAIFGDNSSSETVALLGLASFGIMAPVLAVPLVDAQNSITNIKERLSQLEKLKNRSN